MCNKNIRSEEFNYALNDLTEIQARGGLAQDTAFKDIYKTDTVLINTIFRIGKQDGMCTDHIEEIILEETGIRDRIRNNTIIDDLGALISNNVHDNAVSFNNIIADFPHDKEFASKLLYQTYEKFMSCTENERRQIMRSDAEFLYTIGEIIARRSGFRSIEEAFDVDTTRLNIPKIPRGKEMFWNDIGDPEHEIDKILKSKMDSLVSDILTKFYELYPDLYSKLKDHFKGAIVLNTSPEGNVEKLHRLANTKGAEREFKLFAAPQLIDALVMHFLTQKKYYMNNHRRKSIRKNLLKAVLSSIEYL